jgi:hypothetical protein
MGVTQNTPVRRDRRFPTIAALAFGLWLPTTAPGLGCDAGAPGWRDATGACVTWRTLESRCGLPPGPPCTADTPDPQAERLIPPPAGDPSLPPCRGCGCKGGPGYRAPTGRCVAWKELARICGTPLPGACAAEAADPRAPAVAAQDAFIAGKPRRR